MLRKTCYRVGRHRHGNWCRSACEAACSECTFHELHGCASDDNARGLLTAKLTILLSFFALGVSYAQAPDGTSFDWKHKSSSSVTSPEDMRLQMVETVLREGSPALTVGAFHLHQMGDEAAVNIIKILGMRGTITPTEAELTTALTIMEKAFEKPTLIARANDRQPRNAILTAVVRSEQQ